MISENIRHTLNLENRKNLTLSGVGEVISSDEKQVVLNTGMGRLKILGVNLSIGKLNVETGELCLTGNINLIEYKETKGKGELFASIFK